MKTFLVAAMLILGFFGTAHAIPQLNFSDTYTGYTTNLPNSSVAAETSWMNGVLGGSATTARIDNLSVYSWTYLVNDIWRIAIPDFIDYFALKTGNIFGTTNDFFLFENNVDAGYATIALGDMGISASNVGKISHITYRTVDVPEPSVIMLVLFGLVGLLLVNRQRGTTS